MLCESLPLLHCHTLLLLSTHGLVLEGAKTFINIAKRIVFWEPVGDWFDISDSDFSPLDVNFPNVSLAVSQIGSFSSINVMWQAVFPKIGAFYAKIPLMQSKLNVRVMDKIEEIMWNTTVPIISLIPRIRPTDYNPPSYTDTFNLGVDPEEEVSMYRNISEVRSSEFHIVSRCEILNLNSRIVFFRSFSRPTLELR